MPCASQKNRLLGERSSPQLDLGVSVLLALRFRWGRDSPTHAMLNLAPWNLSFHAGLGSVAYCMTNSSCCLAGTSYSLGVSTLGMLTDTNALPLARRRTAFPDQARNKTGLPRTLRSPRDPPIFDCSLRLGCLFMLSSRRAEPFFERSSS